MLNCSSSVFQRGCSSSVAIIWRQIKAIRGRWIVWRENSSSYVFQRGCSSSVAWMINAMLFLVRRIMPGLWLPGFFRPGRSFRPGFFRPGRRGPGCSVRVCFWRGVGTACVHYSAEDLACDHEAFVCVEVG